MFSYTIDVFFAKFAFFIFNEIEKAGEDIVAVFGHGGILQAIIGKVGFGDLLFIYHES